MNHDTVHADGAVLTRDFAPITDNQVPRLTLFGVTM